jgi:2-iminoacetate synthase
MPTAFSQIHAALDAEIRQILASSRCPAPGRVRELLAMSLDAPLGLPALAELLEIGAAPDAATQFGLLRESVIARWRSARGNSVRYVAPIYVSSFCDDTCAYCNFSALRKSTPRKRLTAAELQSEIATVLASGARVVELVYASDVECTLDRFVRDVTLVKAALDGVPGAGVLICTEHLPQDAYEVLHAAGLWGMVQWDETLDRAAYDRWHAASPRKREFVKRMDAHDRAAAAGLSVATGALFGLSDFRYDVLMQVAKARHLAGTHGRAPFVFGTARLKPIGGHDLHLATSVSDRAYETALATYKLALPEAGRWLQTRETFAMNLANLLDGDVFTYRCGDVQPGGYQEIAGTQGHKAGQFGANEMQKATAEGELAARSFRIDYAWLAGRQAACAAD